MTKRESLISAGRLKRMASILPTAREAIADEGMVELRDGIEALIDVAKAASLFQQRSWSHLETPAAKELREALARFGDV